MHSLAKQLVVLLLSLMGKAVFTRADKITKDIIPFYLELTSNASSKSNDIENELVYRTEAHLEQFIAKREDPVWENVRNILLAIEDHSMIQDGEVYRSKTFFVGTIEIEGAVPSSKQIENLQWGAFVGKEKLDYLSGALEESSDSFLQGVINVQLNWTPLPNNSVSTILWACAIGVLIAIILIAGYQQFRKCMNRPESETKSKIKHSKLRNEPQVLHLAETGSLSPNATDDHVFFDETQSIQKKEPLSPGSKDTFDMKTSMDMLAWKHAEEVEAVPFEAVDISRISKSDAQTTLSKGTVDVNNSVDMLAWKHKKNDIPFEADVTGISSTSPNKTLHVDPKNLRIDDRKSKNKAGTKYLSSNLLTQHNEDRFKSHAQRYAEKVHKKRTGISSHNF